MTELRVKAYKHFEERAMPDWGNCNLLESINFENVTYFLRSSDRTEKNWDDVPDDIKNTFDRLGIPEAEQNGLVASLHNTNLRRSITPFGRIWKNKVSFSSTWTLTQNPS